MYVGIPNPNFAMPTAKLSITKEKTGEKIYVLYNPESYSRGREAEFGEQKGLQTDSPSIQFVHGSGETLSMELFFDTFSSGVEAHDRVLEKAKLMANSLLPSPAKKSVKEYTDKVYELTKIEDNDHSPPLLRVEWASLVFKGFMISCRQKFTKFSEMGYPVRAILNVTFREFLKPSEGALRNPMNSPDTAKFRTVHQGDSLWALSAKEYGECSSWRLIAAANGIANPRLLDTGSTLSLPAIES